MMAKDVDFDQQFLKRDVATGAALVQVFSYRRHIMIDHHNKAGEAKLRLSPDEQKLLRDGHSLRKNIPCAAGEVTITVSFAEAEAPAADEQLTKLCELARELHQTDEIEIDPLKSWDDTSTGDDGVWVRAWAFLSNKLLAQHGA